MASVYLGTIHITSCPFFVRTFYIIPHRDIYITSCPFVLTFYSTLHRDNFFPSCRTPHTLYKGTIFLVMNAASANLTFLAATICNDFGVSAGVLQVYQASADFLSQISLAQASLRPLAESFSLLSPGLLSVTHELLIHFFICLVVLCYPSLFNIPNSM